jgi:hypothetical protein
MLSVMPIRRQYPAVFPGTGWRSDSPASLHPRVMYEFRVGLDWDVAGCREIAVYRVRMKSRGHQQPIVVARDTSDRLGLLLWRNIREGIQDENDVESILRLEIHE